MTLRHSNILRAACTAFQYTTGSTPSGVLVCFDASGSSCCFCCKVCADMMARLVGLYIYIYNCRYEKNSTLNYVCDRTEGPEGDRGCVVYIRRKVTIASSNTSAFGKMSTPTDHEILRMIVSYACISMRAIKNGPHMFIYTYKHTYKHFSKTM